MAAAIPSYDDLIGVMKQSYVSPEAMVDDIATQMGDAEVVQNGHRFNQSLNQHSFVFHVAGHAERHMLNDLLKDAGWQVLNVVYMGGWMPPSYMIDYENAFAGTPDVKGYPSYKWSVIELTPIPEDDV